MNKWPFTGVLLVSDMDGTLLNQNDEVSEENKKALEWLA
jgi:hydroxymethylpyrimidine pyrophosphatase-like HAD family hydrolase